MDKKLFDRLVTSMEQHNEMRTSNLLACPFCGDSNRLQAHEMGVQCGNCAAVGPGLIGIPAAEAWNKRTCRNCQDHKARADRFERQAAALMSEWRAAEPPSDLLADGERFRKYFTGKPFRNPWTLDEWRAFVDGPSETKTALPDFSPIFGGAATVETSACRHKWMTASNGFDTICTKCGRREENGRLRPESEEGSL